MPSKVFLGSINGLNTQLVKVEVGVSRGLISFSIVGLLDKAVKESEERVDSEKINHEHIAEALIYRVED